MSLKSLSIRVTTSEVELQNFFNGMRISFKLFSGLAPYKTGRIEEINLVTVNLGKHDQNT